MNNPSTVAEIIAKLQTLPPDLPVYIRPKYSTVIKWYEDIPINTNGIAKMEANGDLDKNITFLV